MKITAENVLWILNDEDVEGLLAFGVPWDENSSEAEIIAERLRRLPVCGIDEVTAVVGAVSEEMFGPFDEQQRQARQEVFRTIARRIVDRWGDR